MALRLLLKLDIGGRGISRIPHRFGELRVEKTLSCFQIVPYTSLSIFVCIRNSKVAMHDIRQTGLMLPYKNCACKVRIRLFLVHSRKE